MNQAAKVQEVQAAKGPLVWLDMDQKALDDAYDQLVYAPNRDQVHKRNMFNSDRVRARLGAPKRLAYGSKEIEKLDLFATTKPNAVAINASAIAPEITAMPAVWASFIFVNALIMPMTVPNNPTKGAVEPTVARLDKPRCKSAVFIAVARLTARLALRKGFFTLVAVSSCKPELTTTAR